MKILFGKIKSLPSETQKGILTDLESFNYAFSRENCVDEFEIGQLCAFHLNNKSRMNKIPQHIQRVYISKDKKRIIDRPKSHLHKGITTKLLTQICANVECGKQKKLKVQLNFRKEVGVTHCVPITEKDEIVYAIRKGRFGHTKFVKNREPEPTHSATIILKKVLQHYKILTSYIGTPSELEPKDHRATTASIEFWNRHALVFGSEAIEEDSITEECPWVYLKR
ncbi:MAG: hypothetical protein ACPG19_06700 [Saprospiraceae bacterium]